MKKNIFLLLSFIVSLVLGKSIALAQEDSSYSIQIECNALTQAYPGHVKSCNEGGLVLNNGVSIPFKGEDIPLNTSKIIDEVNLKPFVTYLFKPTYDYKNEPAQNDGGRVRLYPLINEVYGKNEQEIRKNLVEVNFLGHQVLFNQKNGASEALRQVSIELESLIESNSIKSIYVEPAETFSFRHIANNPNYSPHSYGIAIDLNPDYNDYYWLWKNIKKTKNYQFPLKAIQIFEKHGFIWGGRWVHFDTMHFEYRPEFLAYHQLLIKNEKEHATINTP